MNFHNFQTQLRLFNSAVILITILLLSPALSAATNCATQGQIPQAECQALVDLYNSTNGPAWTDSPANGWNQNNTPCSWTGVTCSSVTSGTVIQIIRNSQNLSGPLPLSLNALTSLTNLQLCTNSLSGTIPSLPVSLTNLDLNTNSLSGIIPSLSTGLMQINLAGNQLTGTIPLSLPPSLLAIYLEGNKLTGTIPPLPVNLANLNLSYNALTGTLPSFAGLNSLSSPNLNLNYNALTGTYTGESLIVSGKQATWQNTQTVAPTVLSATALSSSQVQVNWTPITYTADGGYYQVKYATTPGGSYTNATTTTADKTASSYVVTGLSPVATYYFVVETVTPAHTNQLNNLTSVLSQETSITTCPATTTVTSTADSGPNTLRQALTNVCPSDTIIINVSGSPISLASDLIITQNVTIDANNQAFNVTGKNFVAMGKNIAITNASLINVAAINTSTSTAAPAGNISLTATGTITTQNLWAQSDNISTGPAGKGGDITLNAGNNITVGDVFSYSKATSSTTDNGGDIAITSGGSVAVGSLLASSGGLTNSGNSGSINVQAAGAGASGYILSNGYLTTYSSHGAGNNITLTANGFLKVIGSNTGKSIIANGATAHGTITITTTGTSPFTVGSSAINGTAGDIYHNATNYLTASPVTVLPPYYPPVGININNIVCQNAITVTSTADSGPGSLREATMQICPGGTITLNASPIDLTSGGLVINKDMTITTMGGVNQTVQRNASAGNFNIFTIANGTVQFNNLTITNGISTSTHGGGIEVALGATLTVNNSTLSGNTAMYGGGLYNNGTLTLTNSTLSGNTATFGGGFYNNQTATITGNLFSQNTASNYGGGIYNFGTTTVTNNTFSGNTTSNSGGGIYSSQPLSLINNTFSGNSASSGGGVYNFSTLELKNTLIVNSTSGGDCVNTGTISTNLNNFIGDNTCSPTLTGNSLLGPLQNNGGPTPTFELLTGSPAIDAGDNASCPTTDQRGLPRPRGSLCDIGAYEFQYLQLTLVVGTGGSSVAVSPLGISCGTNCNAYSLNTTVTLTATPAAGYTFSGWTGTNCVDSLTFSTDTTCTANFTLIQTLHR